MANLQQDLERQANASDADNSMMDDEDSGRNGGPIYLFISVLLFSANNSVLTALLQEGKPHFTACNILCASNTIALATFYPLFYQDLTAEKIRSIRRVQWWAMLGSSLAANVVGALLTVEGLARTSVATTAIMGRLESVWFLLLAIFLYKERFNVWIASNAAIILLGVIVAIVEPAFEGKEIKVNVGLLFLLLGGLGYVLSLLIVKGFLAQVPVGIFGAFRILVGTLVYHVLAFLQGDRSFRHLYSSRLWQTMIWYGLVFVTLGQFVWLKALAQCNSQLISMLTSSMFVLNVVWAVIILGKRPTTAEYLGGAIILVSVISSLIENAGYTKSQVIERRRKREEDERAMGEGDIRLDGGGDAKEGIESEEERKERLMSARAELVGRENKYV